MVNMFRWKTLIDLQICFYLLLYIALDRTLAHGGTVFTPINIEISARDASPSSCPGHVQANFYIGTTQHKLSLGLNSWTDFNNIPVFLGINNTQLLWHNKIKNTICLYQDLISGASISLQGVGPHYKLDGVFRKDGVTYKIKPMTTSTHRLRKSTARMRQTGHMISAYHSRHTTKVVDQEKVSNILSRRKRGITPIYEIEIAFVIDYAIYKRWKSKSTKPDSQKADDAIAQIKYYFAHVANEVSLRYESIQDSRFGYRTILSMLYISTTEGDSSWTESAKNQENPVNHGLIVNVDNALTEFKAWVNQRTHYLHYDHVVLFTGHNIFHMAESGQKSILTTGQSYVKGICGTSKQSIVEDTGSMQSATVTAHELGHNLGAVHDGNNSCLAEDQYIMTATLKTRQPDNYDNIFTFSSCSINEFWTRLQELNVANSNCLTDKGQVYNSTEYNTYLSEKPGQRYGLDLQCTNIYGQGSRFCGTKNDTERICKNMICYNPQEDGCYIRSNIGALEGTTCGNNKWCYRGDCVYDAKAPQANEECLFGDYSELLWDNSMTCGEMISSKPWYCYIKINSDLCCGSCGQLYDEQMPGCEYGDKASWCEDLQKHECPLNDDLCCHTCAQYDTGIPGCKYGDKWNGCTKANCNTAIGRENCCETCAPTTTTQTTTPTTTTTTPTTTTTTTVYVDEDTSVAILTTSEVKPSTTHAPQTTTQPILSTFASTSIGPHSRTTSIQTASPTPTTGNRFSTGADETGNDGDTTTDINNINFDQTSTYSPLKLISTTLENSSPISLNTPPGGDTSNNKLTSIKTFTQAFSSEFSTSSMPVTKLFLPTEEVTTISATSSSSKCQMSCVCGLLIIVIHISQCLVKL